MSFQTLSGAKIDFLKPKNIKLEDLAVGLSRMPRYAGQTERSYSVAQHSLFVASLVPELRLQALIHDAQEAFLCDLPTPLKEAMRVLSKGDSPYDELEWRMHKAICKALKVDPYRGFVAVKIWDIRALKLEQDVLRRGKRNPSLEKILALPDGGRRQWLEAVRTTSR